MASLNLRRLAVAVATLSLSFAASIVINNTTIVFSTPSSQCFEHKIVRTCHWLLCGPHGCRVGTSVKARHYVSDTAVSNYANAGGNP